MPHPSFPQMPRQTWRVLVTPPASGAENMALDEALMDRARATGEWVLRVYSWSAPTISLGRNQSARGRYDLDRVRELELDMVRRPTGGRAILHDREITYSVTAPVGDAGDLRESYDRINRLLLRGLRSLGVAASVARPATRSMPPGMAPCFDEPAAGELTLGGRKLAGSAQWRSDDALPSARVDPGRRRPESPGHARARRAAGYFAAGHANRGAWRRAGVGQCRQRPCRCGSRPRRSELSNPRRR
jgi:Lipoate-protein ligase A